ncbi:hypothetical protein HD553DRAFT_126185 [Filobasidium floriforme]|uniref:uncharacterized protein n=1 Tax=Filobasidium floriforme TaxID=5210 RepID=UPI001E8DBC7D|nr:uncharacterized protein HD553DRAFT_126185 [Filobasidium floriforme]KAH8079938.1 hypothetical protein HD553DRAFT_126185 [Filobasidium floriforme]
MLHRIIYRMRYDARQQGSLDHSRTRRVACTTKWKEAMRPVDDSCATPVTSRRYNNRSRHGLLKSIKDQSLHGWVVIRDSDIPASMNRILSAHDVSMNCPLPWTSPNSPFFIKIHPPSEANQLTPLQPIGIRRIESLSISHQHGYISYRVRISNIHPNIKKIREIPGVFRLLRLRDAGPGVESAGCILESGETLAHWVLSCALTSGERCLT